MLWRPHLVIKEQRRRQCPALRLGESIRDQRVDVGEKIAQCRECEIALGLCRPRSEAPVPARLGGTDRQVPDGRLADTGLADQPNRTRQRLSGVEKCLDDRDLTRPTDERQIEGRRQWLRTGHCERLS